MRETDLPRSVLFSENRGGAASFVGRCQTPATALSGTLKALSRS